jgi:hypothetical protein
MEPIAFESGMTFQNNCFIATEGIISGFLLSYYSFLGY